MNWISKGGIYMVKILRKKTFKMRKKEIILNTVNCKISIIDLKHSATKINRY